jgi:hypothetical protein
VTVRGHQVVALRGPCRASDNHPRLDHNCPMPGPPDAISRHNAGHGGHLWPTVF